MSCECDPKSKMTVGEWVLGLLGLISPALGLMLVGLVCGGCVNVWCRYSPDEPCIHGVYQPTFYALNGSMVCAFPQMMSDSPSDYGFKAYNLLTIPLGCVVLCDAVAEAAVDTVCLPYDAFQGRSKK